MSVVFHQVLVLFIFIALGFALSKFKILNHEHTKMLSSLLVYIFLPCNIFKTFSSRCTVDYLSNNYNILIVSTAIIIVLYFVMHFLAKLFSAEKYPRAIYEYSLIIPNFGYMGYAMAEAVFDQVGLLNVMMFSLPITVFTYTVGYCKLTKREFSFKKLLSPIIVAMLLGTVFGLTSIKIPEIASSVLSKASACMGPVSMILTGVVISQFSLKFMLEDVKTYILSFLRLVAIPVALGFSLQLLGCSTLIVQCAVVLFAMPCGLNTIIFPNLVGESCKIGAGLAFVSSVCACVTIPLVFSLFNIGG